MKSRFVKMEQRRSRSINVLESTQYKNRQKRRKEAARVRLAKLEELRAKALAEATEKFLRDTIQPERIIMPGTGSGIIVTNRMSLNPAGGVNRDGGK
jgi:hypothetical protein